MKELKIAFGNYTSAFRIDPEYHEKSYALKTEVTNRLLRRIFAAFPQINKDFTEIYRLNHSKKIYFEDLISDIIFTKKANRFNLQFYKDKTKINKEEKDGHYEIKNKEFNKFGGLFYDLKTIAFKFLKFINEMMNLQNDNLDRNIKIFKVSTLAHF
jgi:hypothetical protein